jgi:hypothetical protein
MPVKLDGLDIYALTKIQQTIFAGNLHTSHTSTWIGSDFEE